ncbi:MAG TPA: hypothetical protein VEI02_03420 [Planctomycetota bacterium]|nr:hypothetical protein [Planctomycetota bacterium]
MLTVSTRVTGPFVQFTLSTFQERNIGQGNQEGCEEDREEGDEEGFEEEVSFVGSR